MAAGIELSVLGDESVADTESLAAWLRGERALAGRVRFRPREPRAGEMGALGDIVVSALGADGVLTALAGALGGWLALPRRRDVRIKIQRADGSSVEIDAKHLKRDEVEALLRKAAAEDTA
ncbi:effector-associated constant component EACC1 [Streptomyces sp. URMC 129]|uniref:effector-associated constant component EACC1 n=1 Tax=Streptomyces sp. URMC 129 TaxID=3423407 RepID=UPI003F1BD3AE